MKPESVIRSLQYIADKTNELLSTLRTKYHGLSTFTEEDDFVSYWKFYKELVPYLRQFAKDSGGEELSRLAHEYADVNIEKMDRASTPRNFWISLFSRYQSSEEVERAFIEIGNNVSNLIYQIRIMAE